jgi:hypothetical protein
MASRSTTESSATWLRAPARPNAGREQALDTGFDSTGPRLTTSQRARAGMKRPNGRAAVATDLAV